MKAKSILLIGIAVAAFGCAPRDKKGKLLDNPTSGSIRITIDESLRPLLDAELDTFLGSYQYAHVTPTYTSESAAMDALLKDSVKLAIVTRKLTDDEMEVFKQVKIIPDQIKVANDGVAIILNRDNTDSIFQFSQLQDILQGKITQWKQLDPNSKLGDIEVVLDNPQSGIIRFLNDSIHPVSKLPAYFYGVKDNESVIDYVSKKTSAIGLIGACWISDRDDATVNHFLNTIRVARIGRATKPVQPYQAYIANGEYPLRREIYMISREARMGLCSGLISFIAGDKGQRIVLKSGMVPATMPVRLIEIHGKD